MSYGRLQKCFSWRTKAATWLRKDLRPFIEARNAHDWLPRTCDPAQAHKANNCNVNADLCGSVPLTLWYRLLLDFKELLIVLTLKDVSTKKQQGRKYFMLF